MILQVLFMSNKHLWSKCNLKSSSQQRRTLSKIYLPFDLLESKAKVIILFLVLFFFIFFISRRHSIVEKKPHSCFIRTIIVLNIFFLIVIALSIAVIYRFAAIIKESKYSYTNGRTIHSLLSQFLQSISRKKI